MPDLHLANLRRVIAADPQPGASVVNIDVNGASDLPDTSYLRADLSDGTTAVLKIRKETDDRAADPRVGGHQRHRPHHPGHRLGPARDPRQVLLHRVKLNGLPDAPIRKNAGATVRRVAD